MTKHEERQQLLETLRLLTACPGWLSVDMEAVWKEVEIVFDLTTERQETLSRLTGEPPDRFIP